MEFNDHYPALTVGKVVIEWSGEAILGSCIFE